MMVISTLPPPSNAVQCQEISGQTLPCSYATQNLSNGQEVVVITVYAPANYVFAGYGPWTVVKLIVHETKTRIVHLCPDDHILNHTSHKCVTPLYCPLPKGYHIDSITHKCVPDRCPPGQVYNPVTRKCETGKCERPDAGAKEDVDKDLKTIDCDLGDANEHGKTPPQPPSCNSANYNGTCLPINNTKTSSGGSGVGSTCVNNCTTGTPPPVDCTKNPTHPSCTQSLTPSTTGPTTKTCPDGSVIDASANCPTQSTPPTNPNTPSTPPSTSGTLPPSNNPPPSGSNNGGGGGSSGSGGSGSGSGGGSGPSQPSTGS